MYPEKLRKIKNAPKQLFFKGNIELLSTDSISIIGSRACSIEGIQQAKKFAGELSKYGITIVSGMAVGIDTAAHIGALEVSGSTIAVLGSGFNNIFPKENIKLFDEIIKKGGLVVSEYAPSIEPNSKNFLERNRIISGLSDGILVIEAAYRSGTSVTCKIGKEQNKEIFCVPHDLKNRYGVGTNKLIKNGAHLITSVKDILSYFNIANYNDLDNEEKISNQIIIDDKFLDVYNLLIGPPLNINQICNKLCKNSNEVNNALLMLELDGLIIKTKHGYQAKVL